MISFCLHESTILEYKLVINLKIILRNISLYVLPLLIFFIASAAQLSANERANTIMYCPAIYKIIGYDNTDYFFESRNSLDITAKTEAVLAQIPVSHYWKKMGKALEIIETDISNIDDFIYSTEKFFRKQLRLGTMTEQNLRDFAKSCPLYWE